MGGEGVEVVLDAGGDEEDRDEDPEAGGLELAAEVGVGHRAVAVDERDDRAGDEGAEDDLEAELGGQRHEPDEQDEGGADADLRGGVLEALQDLAQAPGVLDAGDRQRDEHGDHEQPAEQDDLRRGGARLAREEEREQDHGGEVGDRARGDDELAEGRADLVGVLEHRHEHAQRGGRQHDGHEQRLGGQAARLQRHAHDDREHERDGEAEQREPQDAPAQALEVDLQAGEEEQVGQPDGREDLHGVVHVDPPEHRGPHDDPEHDLDHDRRDAHGRHEAERRAGRRSPIATMMSRFVKVSSMTLRSHRGRACRYA